MKYILLLISLTFAFSSCAMADNYERGIITRVDPIYAEIPVNRYMTQCHDVYRHRNSGGDVLAGAIIGGLAGRSITRDNGGAAVGAIVGGVIGSEISRSRRVETHCQNVIVSTYETQFLHYQVEYRMNNRYYIFVTHDYYAPGNIIYGHPTR